METAWSNDSGDLPIQDIDFFSRALLDINLRPVAGAIENNFLIIELRPSISWVSEASMQPMQ
eukprot:9501352-Pyramimonas_sp.AAC.2